MKRGLHILRKWIGRVPQTKQSYRTRTWSAALGRYVHTKFNLKGEYYLVVGKVHHICGWVINVMNEMAKCDGALRKNSTPCFQISYQPCSFLLRNPSDLRNSLINDSGFCFCFRSLTLYWYALVLVATLQHHQLYSGAKKQEEDTQRHPYIKINYRIICLENNKTVTFVCL